MFGDQIAYKWPFVKDHDVRASWLYVYFGLHMASYYLMFEDDPKFIRHWFDNSCGRHFDWSNVLKYSNYW